MNIVVCLKQVPDATNVRIDPKTNTLIRDGVESIVNPFDEYALEQALLLKDRLGAKVTVISMGPPQAKVVLREALARGADRAFLVSSRAFGGADTLATAYTLSLAIRKSLDSATPDLVLFGKQAIDGDTAQVGPGVSEFLGLNLVTYVREIELKSGVEVEERKFRAITVMDDGEHVVEGELPAVMTVVKEADEPRFASLVGSMNASRAEITVLDEKAFAADPRQIGLDGSPTKVVRIFPPPVKGGGRRLDWNGGASETLSELLKELKS